jgi:hypothetical protein
MLTGIRNTISSLFSRQPNKQDTGSSSEGPDASQPVPGADDGFQKQPTPTNPNPPGGLQRTQPVGHDREEIPDLNDASTARRATPVEPSPAEPPPPPGAPPVRHLTADLDTGDVVDGGFGTGQTVPRPEMITDTIDTRFGAGDVTAVVDANPQEEEEIPQTAHTTDWTAIEREPLVFRDTEVSGDPCDGGEFSGGPFDIVRQAELAVAEDPDAGGEIA